MEGRPSDLLAYTQRLHARVAASLVRADAVLDRVRQTHLRVRRTRDAARRIRALRGEATPLWPATLRAAFWMRLH